MPRSLTSSLASLALIALASCQSTAPAKSAPPPADVQAVRTTLDALYAAFCFDARAGANWNGIRDLCADGAVFVAPIAPKKAPRPVGIEDFLREFHEYAASDPVRNTGLHERIVHAQIDGFGSIAHAYVAFEGFVPGLGTVMNRGVDSVQLVKIGDNWRVVSFTTQYEQRGSPVPDRFMQD